LRQEAFEAVPVERVVRQRQGVPGRARLEEGAHSRAQRPAKAGNVYVERLCRRLGRVRRPDRVDQRVWSHDLVHVDEKDGEERALFRRPQVYEATVDARLERAENPELE
jgi:hypothetical protein